MSRTNTAPKSASRIKAASVDRNSIGFVENAEYEVNHFARNKEGEATTGALLRAALCGWFDSDDVAADALCQIAEEITVLELACTLDGQDGEGRLNPEIFRAAFAGVARRARVAAELSRRIREEERLSALGGSQ